MSGFLCQTQMLHDCQGKWSLLWYSATSTRYQARVDCISQWKRTPWNSCQMLEKKKKKKKEEEEKRKPVLSNLALQTTVAFHYFPYWGMRPWPPFKVIVCITAWQKRWTWAIVHHSLYGMTVITSCQCCNLTWLLPN